MNIETRFDLYEGISFVKDGKIARSVVRGIRLEITGWEKISTVYLCNKDHEAVGYTDEVPDDKAYKRETDIVTEGAIPMGSIIAGAKPLIKALQEYFAPWPDCFHIQLDLYKFEPEEKTEP